MAELGYDGGIVWFPRAGVRAQLDPLLFREREERVSHPLERIIEQRFQSKDARERAREAEPVPTGVRT